MNVVNWPIGRVLMSYFASKYVRIVTGFKVHDTTAGFVCYRRKVLETIDLDAIRFKGYAFQIEMKYTAHRIGFKIKEVPVITSAGYPASLTPFDTCCIALTKSFASCTETTS